jgi:nitrile hydratase
LVSGEWERRALPALAMGMTGSWNIDISCHARERLPAMQYWSSGYYEVWIAGLMTLVTEAGLVKMKLTGHASTPPKPVTRSQRAMIPAILQKAGHQAARASESQIGIGDKSVHGI